MAKEWKYVYIDTIKVTKEYAEELGGEVFSISYESVDMYPDCALEYHTEYGLVFIFSDVELDLPLITHYLSIGISQISEKDLEGI